MISATYSMILLYIECLQSIDFLSFRLLSKNLKIYKTKLSILLYGFEIGFLTLREECRLNVYLETGL